MKKYFILLSLVASFSCSRELLESSSNDEQATTPFRSCTTIESDISEGLTKRTSYKGSYWYSGQTIRIKFLNGDAYLQNKVKQYANQWLQYTNLKYEWVTSGAAAIKIGFKWNDDVGSWSYIGTRCYTSTQNSPSMNFGWFDNSTSEEEFSRVVIHEFGHALGFAHEHQNPTFPIQWNTAAVYDYYALVGWSQEKVDQNILNKFSSSTVDYTNFDAQSIMMYSFPSSLTLNGYSFPWNSVLSNEDKASAAALYPSPVSVITDRLVSGQSLRAGQYLLSKNYYYELRLNDNGNLEIKSVLGKIIWQTNRIGVGGTASITRVDMQTDGNFTVYLGRTVLWSTQTAGKIGSSITLENTGNLILRDHLGITVWSSNGGKAR